MADFPIQQIDADIAEIERLMTELRLKIAVGRSAGEDTAESERRVQEMLKGWMLLQDQRQKAVGAELAHRVPARPPGRTEPKSSFRPLRDVD